MKKVFYTQSDLEKAYHKGYAEGVLAGNPKLKQNLAINRLHDMGLTYGQIKKALGIKWTTSIVYAIKNRKQISK